MQDRLTSNTCKCSRAKTSRKGRPKQTARSTKSADDLKREKKASASTSRVRTKRHPDRQANNVVLGANGVIQASLKSEMPTRIPSLSSRLTTIHSI